MTHTKERVGGGGKSGGGGASGSWDIDASVLGPDLYPIMEPTPIPLPANLRVEPNITANGLAKRPPFSDGIQFKKVDEKLEKSLNLKPNRTIKIAKTNSGGGGSGNTMGIVTNTPAPKNSVLGASNPDVIAETKEEKGFFASVWGAAKKGLKKAGEWVSENAMEVLHGTLDVIGMIPVIGEIADGINGVIYLAEGRHAEAALSFAAMVPVVGWGATAGKVGMKIAKGAKASQSAQTAAKTTAKKTAQNGSANAGTKVKGNSKGNSTGQKDSKCPCCNKPPLVPPPIDAINIYPVDAATGSKVLYDEEDSFLQGKIAITIDRTYDSAIQETSIFGQGWVFAYEMMLEEQDELLIYRTRHGRVIEIPKNYELLETVFVTNENLWFEKEDQHQYRLWGTKGEYYHFKRCEVERHLFRLSSISNKQGGLITFDYDVVSEISQIPKITAIRDQNSFNATLLHYKTVDIKGAQEVRLEQVSHQYLSGSESLIARYEYSQNGQLSAMFDCDNIAQRTFIYNDDLLMIKHTYASGLESEYEWQMFLDENEEEDFKVVRTFNNRGESFEIEYFLEEKLTKSVNHEGLSEFFYYDENHNITKHIAPDGAENRYYYDDNGIMTSAVTDVGLTYHLEIDDLNRFTQVSSESINPLTEEKEIRTHHYQYFRDTFNISRYEDPEGHFWSTGYGASDQVVDESTPLGEVTHYYYNQQHDLVKRIDAHQNEYLYQWNNRGQLTRQIDCSGNKTHYQYDEKGLLTKVTNALQQITEYQYDGQNRLVSVIDAQKQIEKICYTDFGAVKDFTDKAGNTMHYQYDETGQLIGIKDRLGRQLAYEYDPAGNLLALTNQNGEKYRFQYDPVGRLLREERVDQTALEYQYHQGLLKQIDHIGDRGGIKSTELTINAWNELLIKKSGDIENHYLYNANGDLLEAFGVSQTFADHRFHPLQFTYNANGQVISEASPEGTLHYQHDALGNLDKVTLPNGDEIDYLRYGSGYVHGILWNREEIINFEHNALHQEIFRSLGERKLTTQYDALGRIQSHVYDDITPNHPLSAGNGTRKSNLQRQFSYNALDELTELTDSLKGNRRYRYDAEGRLQSCLSGAFPEVKGGGSWESFSYDHADNILNHYATSLSAHEETVKTNRIKDYNAELYTYDEWGTYLSVYNGQKRRGFRFNAENVLIGSSGEYRGKHYSAEYEYDALGRRIGKKISYFADRLQEETLETQETRFIWMGMQMIEERQAQSQGVSPALASELIAQNIHPDQYIPKPKESLYRYIYRPDGSYEPLAQIRKLTAEEREAEHKNNPYYRQIPDYRLPAIEESSDEKSLKTDEIRYYQNHLNGAPEELVDSAGNILWAENPTAWGQDQYDVDSIRKNTHQPIRFQGQYRDVETGLHYNTFRYYNPHCGRFINQDPIGLNGGLNLYQYAPNPILWIDPWGWNAKPETAAEFANRIRNLGTNERIAKIKGKLDKVANNNGWIKDNILTKKNGRDVYRTSNGELRAMDTQHGTFEYLDKNGKHLGEFDYDGNEQKGKRDRSGGHDIKC